MTEDQIQTLREIADSLGASGGTIVYASHEAALRAALTLAGQTCGNCKHTRDGEPKDGWIWCHEKSEHWRIRDGCRLGWAPKEETTK